MLATEALPRHALSLMEEAGQAALNSADAESAIRVLARACFESLGDPEAAQKPGALHPGEHQYVIAGAFFVTPDRKYHMLVGNVGFPAEQERLMVPIDGGHPGQVYASRAKLLLKNTDEHASFRQYLRSSRMGSTLFAPIIWKEQFLGQLIMAAQARYTMREEDLAVIVALSRIAAGAWVAHGGPAWLESIYPPPNGFHVGRDGLDSESSTPTAT